MPQNSEAPHAGEASRNSLDSFRDCLNPLTLQSQFLIAAYNVRPEMAAMMAAAVFGSACHG